MKKTSTLKEWSPSNAIRKLTDNRQQANWWANHSKYVYDYRSNAIQIRK